MTVYDRDLSKALYNSLAKTNDSWSSDEDNDRRSSRKTSGLSMRDEDNDRRSSRKTSQQIVIDEDDDGFDLAALSPKPRRGYPTFSNTPSSNSVSRLASPRIPFLASYHDGSSTNSQFSLGSEGIIDDDDDPELRLAIAASLSDLTEVRRLHSVQDGFPHTSSLAASSVPVKPVEKPAPKIKDVPKRDVEPVPDLDHKLNEALDNIKGCFLVSSTSSLSAPSFSDLDLMFADQRQLWREDTSPPNLLPLDNLDPNCRWSFMLGLPNGENVAQDFSNCELLGNVIQYVRNYTQHHGPIELTVPMGGFKAGSHTHDQDLDKPLKEIPGLSKRMRLTCRLVKD